jgi:lipoprotein-anchoring transpeptidase ErfK/SrfK
MPFNSEFVHREIRLGVKAHKAGDNQAAWLHFQAALREDTQNTTALLWLAYLADSHEKRIFLLKRVLEIDPNNQRAQAGLKWAEEEKQREVEQARTEIATTSGEVQPATREEVLDLNQRLKNTVGAEDLKEQAKKGTIAQRARRRISPLIFLVVGVLAIAITLLAASWLNPSPSLAALSPQEEAATAALVAVAIATFTPSPIATRIDILFPTATPLPPTPLPTPALPTVTPVSLAYQTASVDEKWIEVILSEQRVVAWEGAQAVMSFSASTGLPGTPTRVGQFHIYQKYLSTRMTGPGYNLPNVPYTMYYDGGYSLHGTYWHNNFGQPMSHGCVNLSTEDAEQLFAWAGPVIPEGSRQVTATKNNSGTLVVVHQ